MYLYLQINLIGLIAGASATAFTECYAPDLSLSSGLGYLPCISIDNVYSMCCVLNITALVAAGFSAANSDVCLPDGLCSGSGSRSAFFQRAFCTDPTWKSPSCLNICLGDQACFHVTYENSGGSSSSYSTMSHCADKNWCCGEDNLTSCCNKGLGFPIAASIAPYAANTSETVMVTVTGALATVTVNSQPTTVLSNVSGNNNVSIGLGVVFGVALLVIAGLSFFLYRRRQSLQSSDEKWHETTNSGVLAEPFVVREVPERNGPTEMNTQTAEMDV